MVGRSGNTLLVVLLAALVLSPGAAAWAWPVNGPVLRPFVSVGDPYAGGQHRGIDIGAPTGSDVRSAARGVVAFAGRLPRQGLCLTVRTEDGWSVTLVHLGSIGVPVGTQVSEGDVVGTIGPSGEPEGTEPYVYLGIRLTADPNGYVDPLTLLPPRQAPEQAPPVQQTSPVQAPAPPVAARQAGPSRSAPRRRHAAAAKARVPQRSARTPRRRDSSWAREFDAEGRGSTQRGLSMLGARPPEREPFVREARALDLPRRTRHLRGSRRNVLLLTRTRTASRRHPRRWSWKRGRVARGGCC